MTPSAKSPRISGVSGLSWDDFRLLVESVVDYAIFMLDPQGRVATWNLGAERIKGYTSAEIVGQHFSKFYPPEAVAEGKPERALATAVEAGRFEDEGFRIRKDGSRFWANVVITPLYDDAHDLRGFAKITRDLTQRRAAEEQIRQAEKRYHDLVDAVSDYAIYLLDASGHVSTWNEGAKRIKGYTASEIVGEHYSRFYTPEDVAAGKPVRVLQTVRERGRYEEEGWRVRKDGSRFWANVVVTPLRDESGQTVGFAKATRDLTERKKGEEAQRELIREQAARAAAEAAETRLRESEERYRELSGRLEVILQNIADGITVQERSGRVIFANPAAARVCGFDSVDELLATPAAEVVARFEILDERGSPFDPAALPGRRVLEGKEPGSAILHVRNRATGKEWWSLVRASAVLDARGKPELAINVWHDVTIERRQERQQKQLADATAVLSASLDVREALSAFARALVPGIADWCSIHLLEGDEPRVVIVAPAEVGRGNLARELERLEPPGATAVLRTGRATLYASVDEATLATLASGAAELDALRAVGPRSAVIAPIHIRERVSGVLGLFFAESRRRYDDLDLALVEELARRAGIALENAELYRAAHASARRAEQASRVKDEFLATVSHELRTPLNAIVGWSALLRARGLEPSIAKGVDVIHRNAEAQGKIIEDILDVSRIITGKLRLEIKPADLVSIVRDAIEVVRPSAVAKRIAVEFTPPEEACLLVGDPERLQQVVWNLLSNAVKFTDPDGSVVVWLERRRSELVVSVTDTGRGIDPEFLPYVFDRFKQADGSTTRRFGGLGLGLSIVRHIAELHGGRVEARSEGPGRGATFTITLPVRAIAASRDDPAPSAPGEAGRAPDPFVSLAGLRVLVVDDELDARDLLQVVLIEAGAEVEVAASAEEAFAAVRRSRPHVIVSDIGMPEEDGYGLMRRVRALGSEQGGGIPAIALTAYTRSEDQSRALGVGFSAHMSKPVNPADLVAAVANLAKLSPRSVES